MFSDLKLRQLMSRSEPLCQTVLLQHAVPSQYVYNDWSLIVTWRYWLFTVTKKRPSGSTPPKVLVTKPSSPLPPLVMQDYPLSPSHNAAPRIGEKKY